VSVNTLNGPSIDTGSILHQHLTNNSVDAWLTLHLHLSSQQSVKSQLISIDAYESVDAWPTVEQLLIKCSLSINQVVDRGIDRGIDRECWSYYSAVDAFCTHWSSILSRRDTELPVMSSSHRRQLKEWNGCNHQGQKSEQEHATKNFLLFTCTAC